MQPVLGDLSEQSFSTLFSISANHQLLRESELLQTPTQAKDISKPAYICVWRTSGVERELTVLFELPCPKPLVVSTNHRLYHFIIWNNTAQECKCISAIWVKTFIFKDVLLDSSRYQDAKTYGGSGGAQIWHNSYIWDVCPVADLLEP